MQHLPGVDVEHLALRTEVVNLVDNEMPQASRVLEEMRRERHEEPRALADHPTAEINQARPIPAGDELGDVSSGVLVDRHVRVLPTEDHNRIASPLPVGRRLDAVPVAFWIHDAYRLVALEQVFDEHAQRGALAGAGLAEHDGVLLDRSGWNGQSHSAFALPLLKRFGFVQVLKWETCTFAS